LVIRRAGGIFVDVALLLLFVGGGSAIAIAELAPEWRLPAAVAATVLIGAAVARMCLARTEIGPEGVDIVGLWRKRRVSWSQVEEVRIEYETGPPPEPTIRLQTRPSGYIDLPESLGVRGAKCRILVATLNVYAARNGIPSSVTEAELAAGRE